MEGRLAFSGTTRGRVKILKLRGMREISFCNMFRDNTMLQCYIIKYNFSWRNKSSVTSETLHTDIKETLNRISTFPLPLELKNEWWLTLSDIM